MTNQAFPTINDITPSWADIAATFTIFGGALLDMSDFAGIKFGDKVEVGERRGASGGRLMGRTQGSVTPDASATLYRSGYRQLVKGLAAQGQKRGNQVLISPVSFDIIVQHTPFGETEIYVVKLKGCRLLGRTFDFKEGQDADKVDITLNPIEIAEIIDGQEIVML